MEELVESELDATIKDGGTRRELLARKIVAQMLSNKGGDALLKEYLRRVWPEVHKAEVRAEVDMNAEIDLAAQELRAMLGGDGGAYRYAKPIYARRF